MALHQARLGLGFRLCRTGDLEETTHPMEFEREKLLMQNRKQQYLTAIIENIFFEWVQGFYINRAAHHGASVQGLLQDREQVVWSFLGFVQFPDTSSKVFHGLQCTAAFQRLVAAVQSKVIRTLMSTTRIQQSVGAPHQTYEVS